MWACACRSGSQIDGCAAPIDREAFDTTLFRHNASQQKRLGLYARFQPITILLSSDHLHCLPKVDSTTLCSYGENAEVFQSDVVLDYV